MAGSQWWRTAVIYEILVPSFQDSDGDGWGDLPGITRRLDYLHDLGVDALWLTPIHPSPLYDIGYDVSDYTDVHPRFGTLDDFDDLTAAAHARNMRVIIDFAPNHTSVHHPWFQASRSSQEHPQRDWYLWADPAPPGDRPPRCRNTAAITSASRCPDDSPGAGFSTGEPWLPIDDATRERNVRRQLDYPGSLLNFYLHLLRFRASQSALLLGDYAPLEAPEPLLAFLRFDGQQRLLIAANLSDEEACVDLQAIGCDACCGELLFATVPGLEGRFERQLPLGPRQAAVTRLHG